MITVGDGVLGGNEIQMKVKGWSGHDMLNILILAEDGEMVFFPCAYTQIRQPIGSQEQGPHEITNLLSLWSCTFKP